MGVNIELGFLILLFGSACFQGQLSLQPIELLGKGPTVPGNAGTEIVGGRPSWAITVALRWAAASSPLSSLMPNSWIGKAHTVS